MSLQYIIDESGRRTAVLIALQDWENYQAEVEKLKRKIEVLTGIQDALLEVKEIKQGKKPSRTLSEFLNEC